MSNWIELTASDQHRFKAYVAEPDGEPRGGVVVVQEIFGVNAHIRDVCARFAAEGYVAVAPALFDRLERDFERGYEPDDIAAGRALMQRYDMAWAEADLGAALEYLAPRGKVGIVGFCLGGSLAYLMATRRDDLACAVGYYGGRIPDMADQAPNCPTILHFGEQDGGIPMDRVDIVRRKQPDLPIYTYPAGHGFNCDRRGSFEPESARLAWERTLALLSEASA